MYVFFMGFFLLLFSNLFLVLPWRVCIHNLMCVCCSVDCAKMGSNGSNACVLCTDCSEYASVGFAYSWHVSLLYSREGPCKLCPTCALHIPLEVSVSVTLSRLRWQYAESDRYCLLASLATLNLVTASQMAGQLGALICSTGCVCVCDRGV